MSLIDALNVFIDINTGYYLKIARNVQRENPRSWYIKFTKNP